jgi:hypothetical protein
LVQHPGLVSPPLRPLPSLCLPQTLHDLQVKLSMTTWNKLMMNDALPIKTPSHLIDSDMLFLVATMMIFPPTVMIEIQQLKSLCKSFCQFETEFHANTLPFKVLHVSTCKNHKRPKRQVHSIACT